MCVLLLNFTKIHEWELNSAERFWRRNSLSRRTAASHCQQSDNSLYSTAAQHWSIYDSRVWSSMRQENRCYEIFIISCSADVMPSLVLRVTCWMYTQTLTRGRSACSRSNVRLSCITSTDKTHWRTVLSWSLEWLQDSDKHRTVWKRSRSWRIHCITHSQWNIHAAAASVRPECPFPHPVTIATTTSTTQTHPRTHTHTHTMPRPVMPDMAEIVQCN